VIFSLRLCPIHFEDDKSRARDVGEQMDMRSKRLKPGDRDLARRLFSTMAEVFGEDHETLSDAYIDSLIGREDFWAIAAYIDDQIIGGITAHTLPMTRTESSEVFVYDIAVRSDHRRKGVGRLLMSELRNNASARGIRVLFVPAENDDLHALDFYRALGGTPSQVTVFTFTHREE
jgi:aminoglycoside 3-N-acetyltransferase I